jgi:hypothetical protein
VTTTALVKNGCGNDRSCRSAPFEQDRRPREELHEQKHARRSEEPVALLECAVVDAACKSKLSLLVFRREFAFVVHAPQHGRAEADPRGSGAEGEQYEYLGIRTAEGLCSYERRNNSSRGKDDARALPEGAQDSGLPVQTAQHLFQGKVGAFVFGASRVHD